MRVHLLTGTRFGRVKLQPTVGVVPLRHAKTEIRCDCPNAVTMARAHRNKEWAIKIKCATPGGTGKARGDHRAPVAWARV